MWTNVSTANQLSPFILIHQLPTDSAGSYVNITLEEIAAETELQDDEIYMKEAKNLAEH